MFYRQKNNGQYLAILWRSVELSILDAKYERSKFGKFKGSKFSAKLVAKASIFLKVSNDAFKAGGEKITFKKRTFKGAPVSKGLYNPL